MQIVMHLIKNLMQTKGKNRKNQAFQAKWYGTLRAYQINEKTPDWVFFYYLALWDTNPGKKGFDDEMRGTRECAGEA